GDFLLHNVGTGDGIVMAMPEHYGRRVYQVKWKELSLDSIARTQNKVRTAPLWGVRLRPRLMHDQASLTLLDAIVRHRGLASLAVIKKIRVATGGLDGIMYDDFSGHIILTNHSRPIGTVVALDPASGAIAGTVELEDDAPEGAASDGKGRIFVNNEGKSTM